MTYNVYQEGRLGYNPDTKRYGFLVSDLWEISGLHCGDCFEVKVNGEWIPTRIEKNIDNLWCLMGTSLKGDELEYQMVRFLKA